MPRELRHLADSPVRGTRLQDGDRAVANRPVRVRDEPVGVGAKNRPETRAVGAGAVRRIERKEPRRDLRKRRAAIRARVIGRKQLFGPVRTKRRRARPKRGRRSRSNRRAASDNRGPRAPGHEPIDDDFDRVLLLLVELRRRIEVDHCAVDAGPRNPSWTICAICFLYSPFLPTTYGARTEKARPFRHAKRRSPSPGRSARRSNGRISGSAVCRSTRREREGSRRSP